MTKNTKKIGLDLGGPTAAKHYVTCGQLHRCYKTAGVEGLFDQLITLIKGQLKLCETPPAENSFCHSIFKFSLHKLQLKIIGNLKEKKEKRESNLSIKKINF